MTTSGATNDNKWQRMTTNGTASDNELYKKSQRMTTNDNELQRMTASDKEWLFQLIFLFSK